MAYTADVNRWRGPVEEPYRPRMFDSPWHPGWIAVTILGFIIWWPIGLALLFYTLGSRKMACWGHGDRWQNKMERMQWKMERMRNHMDRHGFGFGPPSSGNRAFDEYRMETLRRLEEEQPNSRNSSIGCATPRTRKSSTSSWRNTARAQPRRTTSRRRAEHPNKRSRASGVSPP